MTTRQVSALVSRAPIKGDAVILSLHTYRGGTFCTVDMTVEQAQALLSQLDEAVALMTAKPVEDAR